MIDKCDIHYYIHWLFLLNVNLPSAYKSFHETCHLLYTFTDAELVIDNCEIHYYDHGLFLFNVDLPFTYKSFHETCHLLYIFTDAELVKAKKQAQQDGEGMVLNKVRLCFQAAIDQEGDGQLTSLPSVTSELIYDCSECLPIFFLLLIRFQQNLQYRWRWGGFRCPTMQYSNQDASRNNCVVMFTNHR